MLIMRRKQRPLGKPQINMMPMIDVIFLLLMFFVLTFRIIVPEGDFNVQMSPMGHAQPVEIDTNAVQVRLVADGNGRLLAIRLNDEEVEHFDLLRQRMAAISLTNPDLEVVLIPDEHLRYNYFIQAITAVNGEIHEGQIRKICENIRFARPPQSQ
jgi:biopolymer transport protein ExbD